MQEELVRLAQQGDAEAFDSLARMVGDRTLAKRCGSLGDVTILSGDVTSANPDEIRAIATIVDGTVVYCSDTEVCGGG